MKIIKTSLPDPKQKERIRELWNEEYPKQLAVSSESFDAFLLTTDRQNHYLIISVANEIAGWAFTFDRAGERWFSIIIETSHQRKGYGCVLLQLLKEKESVLNGWVIDHPHDVRQNGLPYVSPLSFYLQNGFTTLTGIRLEDDKISAVKIVWQK